jgi:hypothetical protein
LFAEYAVFAWSYGRVIQACRIDGDLIPAVDHITGNLGGFASRRRNLAMVLRTINLAKSAGRTASENSGRNRE